MHNIAELEERLSLVRLKMSWEPELIFYSSVLFQLDIEIKELPCKTACTDGKKIFFDPDYICSLSNKLLQGLCLHELRHVIDLHTFRRHKRDPELFNIACDYIIDRDIKNLDFEVPNNMVDQLADMSIYPLGECPEDVYEELVDQSQKIPLLRPDLQPALEQEETSSGTLSKKEKEVCETVKHILIQSVKMAEKMGEKAVGNIPGHIREQVNEWLHPKVPWHIILQQYLSSRRKEDYDWMKPNRRYLSQGIYLPDLYSEHLGEISIYIDVSSSVTDEEYAMQINQFRYIQKILKPEKLHLISFSTRIIEQVTFEPGTPIDIDFPRQGGTDVAEVCEHIKNSHSLCYLIFSDGYFDQRPLQKLKGKDVIYCIYAHASFKPPSGKVIYVE